MLILLLMACGYAFYECSFNNYCISRSATIVAPGSAIKYLSLSMYALIIFALVWGLQLGIDWQDCRHFFRKKEKTALKPVAPPKQGRVGSRKKKKKKR
ncbi:MAG: hypothetical protein KA214_06800 [Neisseriaceae bacterium]|nr:hypothetical protein [Neisseriaceae bacterium]